MAPEYTTPVVIGYEREPDDTDAESIPAYWPATRWKPVIVGMSHADIASF